MSGTDGIIRIFAGTASKGFAQKMCDYLGTQMGDCSTIIFSEGNTFVRINESIRDKDVYFVQTLGLDPNNEFAELLFFLDAFKRASANSVTAIIPYFSYAKGDKKDEPRVSIRARVCAECIELAGADGWLPWICMRPRCRASSRSRWTIYTPSPCFAPMPGG